MKTLDKYLVGILGSLMALSAFAAYREFRITSAESQCQDAKRQIEEVEDRLNLDDFKTMSIAMRSCATALNKIPFKSKETETRIDSIMTIDNQLNAMYPFVVTSKGVIKNPKPDSKPVENSQHTESKTATPISFDNLSHCDQLDAIAKSGKVVSTFVIESGRFWDYANHVHSFCNWHQEQINHARSVVYPPDPVVVTSSHSTPYRYANMTPTDNSHLEEAYTANSDSDFVMPVEQDPTIANRSKTPAEISQWAEFENPENAHKPIDQERLKGKLTPDGKHRDLVWRGE